MTADIWRLSVDGSVIKYHRPIAGDRRPIDARWSGDLGRYHDVNFFKTSTDCQPIIGRPSPDASPMTNPLKIGGSVNETFNLGARTKKRVGRPKNPQNRCRCRPTIDRCRPSFPNFAHRPSADRRFWECKCSITYTPIFRS